MKKRVTRRQASAWLLPLRDCLRSIRQTGDVDTIDGYAVSVDLIDGSAVRIDYLICGFVGLIERALPAVDVRPLTEIADALAARRLVSVSEIDAALRVARAIEDALVRSAVADVQEARLTEEIQIELDAAAELAAGERMAA